MATEKDLTKHYEAILGRPIDLGDPVQLRENVGFRTFHLDGELTSREIGTTGEATKRRRAIRVLDVAGNTIIWENGRIEFPLSDYYYPFTAEFYNYPILYPIVLVATANSRHPIFVTSRQRLSNDQFDVIIELYAWDANGSPVNEVVIDWRCTVPYEEV